MQCSRWERLLRSVLAMPLWRLVGRCRARTGWGGRRAEPASDGNDFGQPFDPRLVSLGRTRRHSAIASSRGLRRHGRHYHRRYARR